jgi:O-antigen/teichoic acid export membrane protein
LSTAKKLASQTLLYGLTYFGGKLLNYFLTPFYTRLFTDTSTYGVIIELYSYITFLNVLYTGGYETAYFFFSSKDDLDSKLKAAPQSNTGILFNTLLFSLIFIPFSGFWAGELGYDNHPKLILFSGLIILFDALVSIPFAQLRKEDKALKFSTLKLLNIGLTILFNTIILVLIPRFIPEFKEWQSGLKAVEMVLLSNVLASGILFLWMSRSFFKIGFLLDITLFKSMLRYSLPIIVLGLAGMVNETLDRILLKYLLTKPPINLTRTEALSQIGIYGACYKLSIFMTLAVQSFKYAAEPFFFKHLKNENGKETYARIMYYFTFVTSFIFIAVSVYLPVIIHINGKNYSAAQGIVPILLIANLFLGWYYYLSQWYKQTGKTYYGAMISIIGAVITLVINIAFIPYFSYWASAIATMICYFSMAWISYYLSKKHYPMPIKFYQTIYWTVSAVILFAVNDTLIHIFNINNLILKMTIGTVLIGIYLIPFYQQEKLLIHTLFKRFSNGNKVS